MTAPTILVSGAGGQSGSLIIHALAAKHISAKALVRDKTNPGRVQSLPGVILTEGDMLQKGTLKPALEGIERAMLISSANDRMVETQCTFIDACKEAGVGHVIKFSGEESQIGYDPQRFKFTREHEQIEDYLESSGLQWTHLRPSQFMQAYLREAPAIKNKGGLYLPLEAIRMSPVDLRDVAEIAAALLVHGGHHGRSLRITGPEALSMSDIAGIISKVTGNPVRYVPITIEERSSILKEAGVADYFISALADQAAERRRNPRARVDLATHQLFGVTPTRFEQFMQRHSADFIQKN